jgi:hypothetical protein
MIPSTARAKAGQALAGGNHAVALGVVSLALALAPPSMPAAANRYSRVSLRWWPSSSARSSSRASSAAKTCSPHSRSDTIAGDREPRPDAMIRAGPHAMTLAAMRIKATVSISPTFRSMDKEHQAPVHRLDRCTDQIRRPQKFASR